MIARLLIALLLITLTAHAALPAKNVEFRGYITTINKAEVIIKGTIGTRAFVIYPGTVFGRGGHQKLANFKSGMHVTVIFSEVLGVAKVENIRPSSPPKPRPPMVPKKSSKTK